MGHERMGTLPKTRRWRDLVEQIAGLYSSQMDVGDVARQSAQNLRTRLRLIHEDEGVNAAFKFLVLLTVASRSENPAARLSEFGIRLPDKPSPLSLAKELRSWSDDKLESQEYWQLAQSAASDTIGLWYDKNQAQQLSLFEPSDQPFQVWRKAGTGAGFCELSRIFFSRFTERYLNYFLEREASAVLPNIPQRDEFSKQLHEHIDEVSQFAFETARITQSFAAGWYNNHARRDIPSDKDIRSFLWVAFGKLRDELLREAE